MIRYLLLREHFTSIRFIALLLLLLIATGNTALCQNTPLALDNIKFQSIKEGLSESTVTCIVQDYKGFLWFGTRNGLNRYNGISYSIYENIYNDSTSLTHSYVNCLFEDSKGNLWVGTVDGLNLYNRNNDTFTHYKWDENDPRSLSHNTITVIYEDANYDLWIGTEGGLNLFDPHTGAFKRFIHNDANPYSLSNDNIQVIFEDKYANLWIGSYGGGLDLFDLEEEKFLHHQHDPSDENSISSNYLRAAYKDRDSDIWIGTKGGLNLLIKDGEQFGFKHYLHDINNENSLPHNIIAAIGEDIHGNLWIGTENGGLSVFDKKRHTFTNYFHDPLDPNSIGSNSIWSIFRDNVGAMWLGTLNSGLRKWDRYQNKFNHYKVLPSKNTLSHNNITCFLEDSRGNLWIGTDGGGLNFYNRESKKFKCYVYDPLNARSIGSNAVISLLEDSRGNLWIGTWEGGLNLFDPETEQFKRYTHDPERPASICSNNIFTLLEDSHGRLWIGAFGGGLDLFDRDLEQFTHIRHKPDGQNCLSNKKIFKLFEDSRKNIWVGTEGGGLNLMDTDNEGNITFTRFSHNPKDPASISGNVIITIAEDSKRNLWIGTFGGGLNMYDYDRKSFTAYRKSDGLPSNVIHGILEDNNGYLWLSTNNGLSKFDPENKIFHNYTIADGLQSHEFIRGAALKTKDGELLFGGINGYNAFYPEDVIDNPNVPPVYITDFRIYNKSVRAGDTGSPLHRDISDTREIVLPYNQNVFSFEFSALNYSQATKNQYAYKLEGYDRDWQYVGNRRNAYYTKVPQGTYTFKVKGSNSDGIWNEKGASVKIIVKPPWYETWWAYLLYISMIAFVFLWYRQNLVNRERLKSDLRLEHMELTKMQEIDQVKSNFFTNISHEFRTPLTLILGPLKSMYAGNFEGDFKKQIRIMIRNSDRLLRLINQLLDLSKLGTGNMKLRASRMDIIGFMKPVIMSFSSFAEKHHVALDFSYPKYPLSVYFDPDKLEKILSNLLSNAIKFTPENGYVHVKVAKALDNKFVSIQIKDTGIGIEKEEMNKIFDHFYQVNTTHHADIKGTGIGLSLTKELVELHQGFIKVESKINKGTEFSVFLPLGKGHLQKQEIIEGYPVESISDTSLEDLDYLKYENELEGPGREKANKEGSGPDKKQHLPSILIVEDNADLRYYIGSQLGSNYHIIKAVDGSEGFGLAVKYLPDLIISDVMMPGMNGYELCKIIKEDQRTGHIPVLLLSAKTSSENQMEGFETGADYYMAKPFDPKVLRLRVKNIIKSRKLLRKYFSKGNGINLEPGKIDIISADEKFLKNALESIEQNMSNSEFSVEDFGRELGMSRMQLYRKLKALTGYSANEFIRTIRLKRAAQLLELHELTIAEITYEVGFNDLQYFRDCFKKMFGVNPSQYGKSINS